MIYSTKDEAQLEANLLNKKGDFIWTVQEFEHQYRGETGKRVAYRPTRRLPSKLERDAAIARSMYINKP